MENKNIRHDSCWWFITDNNDNNCPLLTARNVPIKKKKIRQNSNKTTNRGSIAPKRSGHPFCDQSWAWCCVCFVNNNNNHLLKIKHVYHEWAETRCHFCKNKLKILACAVSGKKHDHLKYLKLY